MNELDPKTYRRLKILARKSKWTSEDRETRELLDKDLVDVDYEGQVDFNDGFKYINVKCSVNDNGAAYLLNHRQASIQRWIPIFISIFSALIAGAALIVAIIALSS